MKNMNRFYIVFITIVVGILLFSFLSCEDDNENEDSIQPPVLSTSSITNITANSAICGGYITDNGGADVIAKGVCWSVNQNPTISNSSTNDGIGVGEFISEITGLDVNTTYYVRAYATNSKGTTYGNEQSFLTLNGLPSGITTISISDTTATSAISGGAITDDGGFDITSKGVCWSTDQNPTIENNITSDGNGTDGYISNITGLNVNTTYYVRAYATNENGTAYGNEIIFTTLDGLPNGITTTAISDITSTSATSGGIIVGDGGFDITSKGVCWSLNQNPTIDDNKTIDGTGTGNFTSNLTGLNPETTYYIRAYATNIIGTSYGNEISFTTNKQLPIITTNDISEITFTTAMSGGEVLSDLGYAITSRGVCWSKDPIPTIENDKTMDGTGLGNYTSKLIGLDINTTYYYCAYATNYLGTGYGEIKSFTTQTYSGETVTDIDGNEYKTVVIGTQEWMVGNLKTTKFNDGTEIELITDGVTWANILSSAYCWYDNDEIANKEDYGALYNWYAVNSRKLCPIGWHVPDYYDITDLINYLGGYDIAGGKLKEIGFTHWNEPNEGATNETGFTALPGGYRIGGYQTYGEFRSKQSAGYFWTLTPIGGTKHWYWVITGKIELKGSSTDVKRMGYSIRCIKD